MQLLRAAASKLPAARAALAICEYRGCNGTTPDTEAAVSDAWAAAELGQLGPILDLSTTLPVGALSPGEGAGWQLFAAVLKQQGCVADNHYVP